MIWEISCRCASWPHIRVIVWLLVLFGAITVAFHFYILYVCTLALHDLWIVMFVIPCVVWADGCCYSSCVCGYAWRITAGSPGSESGSLCSLSLPSAGPFYTHHLPLFSRTMSLEVESVQGKIKLHAGCFWAHCETVKSGICSWGESEAYSYYWGVIF